MDFLKAAHQYVKLGFKVIPLRAGTKEAFTTNGVYDATDDMGIIEAWARDFPDANIAAGCGPDSGISCLDVDKHNGGIETLKGLQRKHGDLPKAPMSRTPRGGFHLYFACDKRVGCTVGSRTNGLGPGLDTKSKGGYITLPPSYWNGWKGDKEELPGGGDYQWIRAPRGNHLPMMPGWMIKILMPKPVPAFAKCQIDMGDLEINQVVQALNTVSNIDYGVWIKMAMALKDQFGDEGFDIWLNWSASGAAALTQEAYRKKWNSFDRGKGVTIGSLFHEARAAGCDLSEIFKEGRPERATNATRHARTNVGIGLV